MAHNKEAEKAFDRHEDDDALRASVNEYENFMDTTVWSDMKMTIEDRIDILQRNLEVAENLDEVRGYQYAIAEMRAMLQLPEYLKECIIEESQSQQK